MSVEMKTHYSCSVYYKAHIKVQTLRINFVKYPRKVLTAIVKTHTHNEFVRNKQNTVFVNTNVLLNKCISVDTHVSSSSSSAHKG